MLLRASPAAAGDEEEDCVPAIMRLIGTAVAAARPASGVAASQVATDDDTEAGVQFSSAALSGAATARAVEAIAALTAESDGLAASKVVRARGVGLLLALCGGGSAPGTAAAAPPR